ncbi:hypothetical protein [Sphingomonas echinoides]|uniref:hypothetical protein n=1 Tax=Sphingomonas echinoides TaxID=59803 RepID=UPI0024135DBF|nr:hypothetical protein [Sphingomonas echinoides]
MVSKLILPVSLILLAGCAQSEPVDNMTVDINAAAVEAQSTVDAYGENAASLDAQDARAMGSTNDDDDAIDDAASTNAVGNEDAPLDPPAPGTPGGLPDDRTPVSEARFTPDSAQGAANVVQTYYAFLGSRRFPEARALVQSGSKIAERDVAAFAATFDRYSEYHANVGAPGRIDAGAGQRYVTVPVQVYARLKADRAPVYSIGTVTLHRAGDIDGATAEQRKWKISDIALKPAPAR